MAEYRVTYNGNTDMFTRTLILNGKTFVDEWKNSNMNLASKQTIHEQIHDTYSEAPNTRDEILIIINNIESYDEFEIVSAIKKLMEYEDGALCNKKE